MNKGKLGELIAKAYLVQNQYQLITTNYFSPAGEIDIIAESSPYHLHFIEVKNYQPRSWVHPIQAVNRKKQHKIKKTASVYLEQCKKEYQEIQFDIITIKNHNIDYHILHAFH